MLQRFAALAKELNVALPISYFERANHSFFNSLAVFDADGSCVGRYRKSHIPDGIGWVTNPKAPITLNAAQQPVYICTTTLQVLGNISVQVERRGVTGCMQVPGEVLLQSGGHRLPDIPDKVCQDRRGHLLGSVVPRGCQVYGPHGCRGASQTLPWGHRMCGAFMDHMRC